MRLFKNRSKIKRKLRLCLAYIRWCMASLIHYLLNLTLFSNSGRFRNLFFRCFITSLLTLNFLLIFYVYRACAQELISATFDTDSSGFTYQDDTFRSTANPGYASGNYDNSGGYAGGGLHVALGGIDGVDITDGMSGGWSRSFVVNGDDTVNVSLWYRLVFSGNYEPDECGQVLVAIDGQLLGSGAQDYLLEYCGFGDDGGPSQDSGWQQVTLEIPLTDGSHTITVGGWNNKKTAPAEAADFFFDEIVITQQGQPPLPETDCGDGVDNDGDGFIDCLDSDCNGVSGCEFGSEATCNDGIDNDGDGLTDCADSDCSTAPNCIEAICDDGVDNDGDGLADCEDPDCFGVDGCGTTIFSATFDRDSEGFTYQDDTFRSTANPGYASGNYDNSGGYAGGGLHVALGGIDGVDITDGMSGGWSRSFVVNGDDTVNVSLWYRLVFSGNYEPDECGQVLVAIDGQLLGSGAQDYLLEYCGFGDDGGPSQDSGWQQVTLEVPLADGSHTITVGGWNNKKTAPAEAADIFFDEIVITQQNDPNIIFFEDFNDGSSDNWTVVNDSGKISDWQVIDGKYTQLARVDEFLQSYHIGSYSFLENGMSLSDYQVSLKMTSLVDVVSDSRDTTGIMFRYQDGNNYYRFSMSRMQGHRRLEKRRNGTFTSLAFDGRAPTLGEEIDVTIIVKTIDVNRSQILVYMNDEPLFSVEDSNHISTGSIALFTQFTAEFDNVLISNIPQTPMVILQHPTSYSLPVTDSSAGPYDLQVVAQGLNVPLNHGVKFIIDSASPDTELIDYTNTYSATFTNVPQGDRTIDALIVDADGNPLSDSMGRDQDTNWSIGLGGKIFISMGDSITNGVGDTITVDNDASNGRILGRGYTPILTDLLSGEVGEPVCVVNEGLGGTTSADGRDRLLATINRYPESQIWLILFGTNDSSGSFPVESGVLCEDEDFDPADPDYEDCSNTFKDIMRTIILDLLAQNKIPVLAKIPFVKNATTVQDDAINEYNQVIQDLYVDYLSVEPPDFYSHFSDPSNQDEFYDDTHPNGDGYVSIANEWFIKLLQSGLLN